jgi:hypothetical protein
LATARSIKENLLENGLKLKPLNQMNKFIWLLKKLFLRF